MGCYPWLLINMAYSPLTTWDAPVPTAGLLTRSALGLGGENVGLSMDWFKGTITGDHGFYSIKHVFFCNISPKPTH